MFSFLKNYFSFTRSQQNGIVVLVLLIVILLIVPYLIPLFVKQPGVDFSGFKKDIAAFEGEDTSEEDEEGGLIELNTANSAQLLALKGIGPVLSKRIVKFRSVLGGFSHVEQLREVYGLGSVWYEKMKISFTVDTTLIEKIPLNTISEDSLTIHPYFRNNIAKEVCAYRDKHGTFKTIGELKKIPQIDEELFRKIRPYVRVE